MNKSLEYGANETNNDERINATTEKDAKLILFLG